jgi:ribosomal protein S18 acetylase RimI-like enzyme
MTHITTEEFTVSPATEADVEGIGEAQLESWVQTYPNAELGIDEEWIRDQVGFLAEKRGNDFRRKTVQASQQPGSNQLYLVVKNQQNRVRGFLHITREVDHATFDAIYLTQEAQGIGIADELMGRALDFAGHLPMTVEVADYNDRAIRFYEKYGFEKQIGDAKKHLHRDKIPIMVMKRPAKEKNEV